VYVCRTCGGEDEHKGCCAGIYHYYEARLSVIVAEEKYQIRKQVAWLSVMLGTIRNSLDMDDLSVTAEKPAASWQCSPRNLLRIAWKEVPLKASPLIMMDGLWGRMKAV
jgi:hypothetical protein